MVQFISIIALTAGVVLAQTGPPTESFNSSVITQVAGEVDTGTSAAWCNAQFRACNVLCNQAVNNNTCTQSTLQYECRCASNNSSPAFQYYNPTMITNICNRYLGDCLQTTAGRADLQNNCKATIVCGNSSIDAYANSSAGQSNPTATSSSSASGTGTATGSTTSPSRAAGAASALQIAQGYATPIFGAILLGAFGLAL